MAKYFEFENEKGDGLNEKEFMFRKLIEDALEEAGYGNPVYVRDDDEEYEPLTPEELELFGIEPGVEAIPIDMDELDMEDFDQTFQEIEEEI